MSTISVQEIQSNPQGFVGRVEAGETLLVLRDERPVAEVRPLPSSGTQPRPFGLCAGQFSLPDDFDAPLPEDILKEFEGS
jgi:antitoxin (DNA-binding transcriptional repressor) of toxin-antitoxin stability system